MISSVARLVQLFCPCALAATVVLTGCGSDEPRYSVPELQAGVAVDVDDQAGAVARAEVFLPDERLAWHRSVFPRLDQDGLVVLQPGEEGYDVVVVYRAGPYCGLLPGVAVQGDVEQLEVDIRSRRAGECDDMEYGEAVGFDLATEFSEAEVTATRSG